ncbi:hypothetical protein [Microbulbifer sp. JSM ZJ756]|uniref:hypothetical protein n=1 Tax=Microbulbifer sp. JSM ZJ756 TaxID=3376191 RepID=UPI00379926AB
MAKVTKDNWRQWLSTLKEFESWSKEVDLRVAPDLTRILSRLQDYGYRQVAQEDRISQLDELEAQRERELVEEERRRSAPATSGNPKKKASPKPKRPKQGKVPKEKRDAGHFTGKVKGIVHCDRCKTKHLDGWRFKRDIGDTQILCRYCRAPIVDREKWSRGGKPPTDALVRRVSGSFGSGKRKK